MKIDENSIRWTLNHIHRFGDTDLFPRPTELEILKEIEDDTIQVLKDVDLGNYRFGSSRRFIVPKDEVAYRTATQLDPLDSLFLTAVIHQFGFQIESRRVHTRENKVFTFKVGPDVKTTNLKK